VGAIFYLTFMAGTLVHLPSAEALPVWPNVHPQKVTVTAEWLWSRKWLWAKDWC